MNERRFATQVLTMTSTLNGLTPGNLLVASGANPVLVVAPAYLRNGIPATPFDAEQDL